MGRCPAGVCNAHASPEHAVLKGFKSTLDPPSNLLVPISCIVHGSSLSSDRCLIDDGGLENKWGLLGAQSEQPRL
eukprot:5638565-Alexandrium_andersonii.AAC.1